MAHRHHPDPPLLRLFMARLLRPLLLGALLLAMQAAPGAEARDEARLKAQLAETLGAVDQSRAIQEIANRLTAELGRENNLALFGAQARAAARGVLSALVTNPGHGCLQWDPSVADSGAGTWVASAAGVREAVERAYERQGGREQGTAEVVVVVENMDRIDCSNIMYLNNLMAVISEHAEARRGMSGGGSKGTGSPTFLFLFEADVGPRVAIERSVKSHWAEHYEAKCHPGPALNLKAFFGRLSEIVLAPLPPSLALGPRDTQPLCKGLPGAGRGLLGDLRQGRTLVFACLGLAVVAGTTYMLSRAAAGKGRGGRGEDGGFGKRPGGSGGGPPAYTPVVGDAVLGADDGGLGGEVAAAFAPTAVKGGATGVRARSRAAGGGGGTTATGAASARAMAASVLGDSPPSTEDSRRSSGRRVSSGGGGGKRAASPGPKRKQK